MNRSEAREIAAQEDNQAGLRLRESAEAMRILSKLQMVEMMARDFHRGCVGMSDEIGELVDGLSDLIGRLEKAIDQ